jgi:hypothetical protein
MATNDNELSRQERFEKYNPYAASLGDLATVADADTIDARAHLAVAFEISQLRTEIHFQGKGRSA